MTNPESNLSKEDLEFLKFFTEKDRKDLIVRFARAEKQHAAEQKREAEGK